MRRINMTGLGRALILVLLGIALGSVTLVAASGGDDGEIHACVGRWSGRLRIVDSATSEEA